MDELMEYRIRINEIDEQLLELLIERFKITSAIGAYKKEQGIAILDPERERIIIENLKNKLENEKDAKYIIAVWEDLMKASKVQQYEETKE